MHMCIHVLFVCVQSNNWGRSHEFEGESSEHGRNCVGQKIQGNAVNTVLMFEMIKPGIKHI